MAILELNFHDINVYVDGKDTVKAGTLKLLSNQQDAGVVDFETSKSAIYIKGKNDKVNRYEFYIEKLDFTKQIYNPTVISTEIFVYPLTTTQGPEEWVPIMKDELEKLFYNHRVSLYSVDGSNSREIGGDYFVGEIEPHYKKLSMSITFNIYSLDKKLDISQNSRSFVAQKLCDDILKSQLKDFTDPYDPTKKLSIEWKNNMHILAYKNKKDERTEHIFPFLVQYNESFHKMLVRTTNRWGEFLYYENGCLNIGYENKVCTEADERDDWSELNYGDIDDGLDVEMADKFTAEAAYDEHIIDSKLKKSPNEIQGVFGCGPKNGLDLWMMKQFPKFFSNTESIPKFFGNLIFDNLYDSLVAEHNKSYLDEKFNEKYFSTNKPVEQYGCEDEPDTFNQFSELKSTYTDKKYLGILNKELQASKNAVFLNYDTTYPNMKVGDIIRIYKEDYMVILVECKTKPKRLIVVHNVDVVEASELPQLAFRVVAIPKNEDGVFYPAISPQGHTRFSGPQLATVTDANDPANQNRVRIMFNGWQIEPKDENGNPIKITDSMRAASSPWVVYATSSASQGNGIFGRHYEGDQVIVDFAHGNVERPYIVGGLSMKGNKVPGGLHERDIVLTSPGGHALRIEDGTGAGLTAFLSGIFAPGYDLLTTIFPDLSGKDIFTDASWLNTNKNSKNFEGGFQLTDKYGIYNISGSTDGRNVSVKSPWGDINLNAFTGITISAPNGDVTIKGKNVKIQAGNNLELVSGTNVSRKLVQSKDTMPGNLTTFMADMALQVAKKFAEKVEFVDLSFVRATAEVIFYPVEGALTVKSNRFLKLEAGKGKCDYPATAYKDQATIDKMNDKIEEDDLRPGLRLRAGVVQLIQKVGSIATEIDREYKNLYNTCVQLHTGNSGLKSMISRNRRYRNKADKREYCKNADKIIETIWQNPDTELQENDIFVAGEFDANDINDVSSFAVNNYGLNLHGTDAEKKQLVVNLRKRVRAEITQKANELRKAIAKLAAFIDKSYTRLEMTEKIGRVDTSYMPANYKDVMTAAFSKDKLGDTFYHKAKAGNRSALNAVLGDNDLADELKALKRKAAILLLEGLGFRDDWRSKTVSIVNARYDANVRPPMAQRVDVEAPRVFNESDVINPLKWSYYVRSITSVPKLSPIESKTAKLKEAALDELKRAVDWEDMQFLAHPREDNWSWGEAKQGGILFNYKGNTYNLKNDIAKIEGASKENLTTTDDGDALNGEVNQFLTEIRATIMALTAPPQP